MIGILAAAAVVAAWPGDWRPTPAQAARLATGDVVVEMLPDPGRSSGVVHAAIDIPAPGQRVWRLLQSCSAAPAIIKFVVSCRIVAHGPPDTWEVREDMIETVFFLPRLRSLIRTDATPEREIRFHCLPGSDLRVCDGSWRLEPRPGGTVRVTYASTVSSPYPVPDFIIRSVLGGGMADSMRKLRAMATAPGP
jgi:uncharacterized membrane protein